MKGYADDTFTVGMQSPPPTSGCEWRISDIMHVFVDIVNLDTEMYVYKQ